MARDEAMSVDEVAELLQVSRNTVYAMKNRGDLPSFKVGRKLRFSYADVQDFIERSKGITEHVAIAPAKSSLVICGQDIILDVLSNYVRQTGVECLRSYVGSYDALTALYKDEVQVASAHLWDSATDEYNVPFVKMLLPSTPTVVVNLTYRNQGLYVAKGNPKGIEQWEDMARDDVRIANREKGAGSRVLLDESLRIAGIDPSEVDGYDNEVQSHIAVASIVARGRADVAVGSEKIARQVKGIDFISMKKERYDLVFKQANADTEGIRSMMAILESGLLREDFASLGGYDTKDMGRIMWMG